jgi:hypothetical protein
MAMGYAFTDVSVLRHLISAVLITAHVADAYCVRDVFNILVPHIPV